MTDPRRITATTRWPQADAGTLPDSTIYEVVICPEGTVAATIAADHPGIDPTSAHSAFYPDATGETDGTFYFTTPTPIAVVVHEAGHATIDTFVRRDLPIPDGDDTSADEEEAFVHFLGMLSELLCGLLAPPDPRREEADQ